MIFRDREDAGRRLGERLGVRRARGDDGSGDSAWGCAGGLCGRTGAGGTARHLSLAKAWGSGAGGAGVRAAAAGDGRYLDERTIRSEGVTEEQIERITAEVRALLEWRAVQYRGERGPLAVSGRTLILIDDGIATGASIYAAVQALRQLRPARIVVAVPVAPASTCVWLRRVVDEMVCLSTPERFFAVGQFYVDFRAGGGCGGGGVVEGAGIREQGVGSRTPPCRHDETVR